MPQVHEAPPRKTDTCRIRFVVRDVAHPDTIAHDETGDYNARYFRDWMDRTTWWALRNAHTVHIYPEAK